MPILAPMTEQIEIYIETLTGVSFEIQVCPGDSIGSIKAKIQYFEGIPISQQHLIWRNQELEDKASFLDYNIVDGSTLKLVLGMRGGPINTKRVGSNSITKIARLICDNDLVDSSEINPFTLIVFQDGANIRMYTLINKDSDDDLPSTSDSSESIRTTFSGQDLDNIKGLQTNKENELMQKKIALLQSKMKNLNLSKKSKLPDNKCQRHENDSLLPPLVSKCDKPSSSSLPYLHDTTRIAQISKQSNYSPYSSTSDRITKCTSALKAMGVKLPTRTSNLVSKPITPLNLGDHEHYSSLFTNDSLKETWTSSRPRTSPEALYQEDSEFSGFLPSSKRLLHSHSSKHPFIAPKNRRVHYRSFHSLNKVRGLSKIKSPLFKEKSSSPAFVSKKPKSIKRCSWCKRKTGLATSYICRCGRNFCSTHRYAETHNCTYDYKTEGKKYLNVAHPLVSAPKLPKI